jgi:hypothetical protein
MQSPCDTISSPAVYVDDAGTPFHSRQGRRISQRGSGFGQPDFIHRNWDARAKSEIVPGDIGVFAYGTERDPIAPYSFDDSATL